MARDGGVLEELLDALGGVVPEFGGAVVAALVAAHPGVGHAELGGIERAESHGVWREWDGAVSSGVAPGDAHSARAAVVLGLAVAVDVEVAEHHQGRLTLLPKRLGALAKAVALQLLLLAFPHHRGHMALHHRRAPHRRVPLVPSRARRRAASRRPRRGIVAVAHGHPARRRE